MQNPVLYAVVGLPMRASYRFRKLALRSANVERRLLPDLKSEISTIAIVARYLSNFNSNLSCWIF